MIRKRLSKKEREAQRMVFEQDDDGHWYCIPLSMQKLFVEMLYEGVDDYTENDDEPFNDKFSAYRLSMHVSNYSFTDMRETEE